MLRDILPASDDFDSAEDLRHCRVGNSVDMSACRSQNFLAYMLLSLPLFPLRRQEDRNGLPLTLFPSRFGHPLLLSICHFLLLLRLAEESTAKSWKRK